MSSLVQITENDKGITLIRRKCFGMEERVIVLVPRPDVNWRSGINYQIGRTIQYLWGILYLVLWRYRLPPGAVIRFSKINALLIATLSDDWGHGGISLLVKQRDWLTCKRCCCICCSCPGRSEIRRRGRTRRRFESRHRSTPGGRETRARAVNIINRPLSTKALGTWFHSRSLAFD